MESFGKFNVGRDQESLSKTPYTDWDCDTFVASMEEDSSSHSLSSWDLVDVVVGEGLSELKEDCFDQEQKNQYGSYDELLKKFLEKEAELRVSNYKLERSEKEVTKLKIQIIEQYCEGQLKFTNEHLKISGDEIGRLTKELGCKLHKTHELQGQLKVVKECAKEFSKTNMDLISRLKEWEERSNTCENKLRKCEAANLELKELHAAQKMALHGEINSLKEEVGKKKDDLEAVNKEFDMHKQKFDILVTERDEANAKIDILKSEIISQEDKFKKMESKAANRLNLVEEYALKVDELEREVAGRNGAISTASAIATTAAASAKQWLRDKL